MSDSFSVELMGSLDEHGDVWRALKTLSKCIEYVHSEAPNRYPGAQWSLARDGRTWQRASLADLRKAIEAAGLDLSSFSIDWPYAPGDVQWSVEARTFGAESTVVLRVKAFAGVDRLHTEQAARGVVNAAKAKGIDLEMGETRLSSTDNGRSVEQASPRSPLRETPPGIGYRAWDGLKSHAVPIVSGVIITVAGGLILYWLGVN